MERLTRYWKSLIAAGGAAFVIVQAFMTDPEVGEIVLDGNITNEEAIRIVVLVLMAAGVFAKKNLPPPGQPADPNVSEASR